MDGKASSILYYVHDPMCSWCWGYRRSWEKMQYELPRSLSVVNVVGGLSPDSDTPMPIAQQKTIAGYWEKIAQETNAEFNFDFWTRCKPRRSTYPACRAVLAAHKQQAENEMIYAIQRAYYLRAMNPSNDTTLTRLALELGLNVEQFTADLASPEIQAALERNLTLRNELNVYGFPSLILKIGEKLFSIPVDYRSHHTGLEAIDNFLFANDRFRNSMLLQDAE